MASRSRAPTRVFELGPRTATAPSRDASAGHHHHARSAVAAVGLERQPPARPEHLPSDRPRPCGPGGLAALVVHSHRSPRTLSLAASLGLPRQGPPGRLELSRASANRLAAVCFERRERCASPTSATDFVHEHPADCCVSGCASTPLPALRRLATLRAPTHPGPWPSGIEILGRPLCPRSR